MFKIKHFVWFPHSCIKDLFRNGRNTSHNFIFLKSLTRWALSQSRRVFEHGDVENAVDWSQPSFGSHLNPYSSLGGADYAHNLLMSPPSFKSHRRPWLLASWTLTCLGKHFHRNLIFFESSTP